MAQVLAEHLGFALFAVAVIGAMVRSIRSQPPRQGRRSPRPPRVEEWGAKGAGGADEERGSRSRRSTPRPTIVGTLLLLSFAPASVGESVATDAEARDRAGAFRILIDSVAASAVVPDQAVAEVVATPIANEGYLPTHQLAQSLLARAGGPVATGRRVDVEALVRARQTGVGTDATGVRSRSRWVQRSALPPRSPAERWSATAMSIGTCTPVQIGPVPVDELRGLVGEAGSIRVQAPLPVRSRRVQGWRS